MCTKLIYLISFILGLGLFLTSPAKGVDPSLVGWWKLDDEGTGTALDYSRNGYHGTLQGNPEWVPGVFGCALEFDGNDSVNLGNASSLNFGTSNWSITAWIKTTMTGTDDANKGSVFANGGDQSGGIRFTLAVSETQEGSITLTTDDDSTKVQATSSTTVNDGLWHHVVGIRDGTTLCVYVDGNLDGINTVPAGYNLSGTSQHNAYIGAITDHSTGSLQKYFDGSIDDVRVYKQALTQDEIEQAMISIPPGVAFDPNPVCCQIDVPPDVVLSWTPGEFADKHDVYLGTNFNDVNDANRTNPLGALVSQNQDLNIYIPTELLQFQQTYYWRVDEVSASPDYTVYEGDVWSFKVAGPLSSALDTTLIFITGGDANWFSQTTTFYYGGGAAQSGDISHSQDSWIQTTVSGTGRVKFYWKVSSEEDYDFLQFRIDGSMKARISGVVDWEQMTYTISTPGLHTLEWRYVKDNSMDSGDDCGWIDKVEW